MIRRAALFLVLLIAVLLPAAPAQAHAYVISTQPANGSQVQTAPAAVRITFDEPVTLASGPSAASVIDADGQRVDTGPARVESGRRTLVIGIRAGLPRGAYIASWSVVSADTHPIGGSIQFGYGVSAAAITASPARQPSAVWELAVGAAKALVYLGLVLALGLVPAGLVLGVGVRRVARIGMAVAVVASLLQGVVQCLWQSAAPAGFAVSSYAVMIYVRIVLLLVLAVVGRRTGWLVSLATLGTVVHNGHGGAGAWWQFVCTLLHVAAMVAWLGGLAMLGWLVLRQRLTAERLARLPVWSAYAASTVAVLALTGVVQSVVGIRYPGALLTTTYGYLLMAKVLLVAVAVLLGAGGNRWIRRQLATPDGRPPSGQTALLRRRVRREAAVGAVVVLLSGVLSSITPAEAAYAPQRTLHLALGPYAVSVAIAPARRGPETFRVTVTGRAADTDPPQSLQLSLGQPAGPVRALTVSFPYRLPGAIRAGAATPVTFSSAAAEVPATGEWRGTLTIVASRLDQYTAVFAFQVA